jgi:hypothetical protein
MHQRMAAQETSAWFDAESFDQPGSRARHPVCPVLWENRMRWAEVGSPSATRGVASTSGYTWRTAMSPPLGNGRGMAGLLWR